MKQFTGDKYKNKGASVETGVSECTPLDSGELRNSGQGQRPTKTRKSVKSDRGTFESAH